MLSSSRLKADIDHQGVLLQLCATAFATGALDAVAFPAYEIFFSNQTGNSIFIFLGAVGLLPAGRLIDVALSLGSWFIAALVCGQLGNVLGRRKRWWLIATNMIQSLTVLIAAVLLHQHVVNNEDHTRYAVIVILSAGSDMQVAMAKTLQCPEAPTAMLTSPYADLVTDPALFRRQFSKSRDRRIVYILSICAGAAAGAAMYRHVGEHQTIYFAAAIKICTAASFWLNPALGMQSRDEEVMRNPQASDAFSLSKAAVDV